MEELKKLKQSVNVANAKISHLIEGIKDLKNSFETIRDDLDTFIDVFEQS